MGKKIKVKLPFLENRIDIGYFYCMVFGDSFVAAEVSTEAFAMRKVNIQTDYFLFSKINIRTIDKLNLLIIIQILYP